MNVRNSGLAGTTGDTLVTCAPIQLSGSVWYVHSTTGTDGAAPAGKDRQKPLATLAQAITNAAANDIVVLLDGHTETLTVALSISKQLYIAGEGFAGGKPTAKFTMNAAAADTFTVSQANTELRNIYFPEASQTNGGGTGGKVVVSAAGCRIIGCYFEQGAKDNLAGLWLAAGSAPIRIQGCTFVSTATTTATRPQSGLNANTAALSDAEIYDTVFDDGTVGFASQAMVAASVTHTRLRMLGISLLRGADIVLGAATTGWVNIQTSTGEGRLEW